MSYASEIHGLQGGAQPGETPRQPQTAQPFRRVCAEMRAVPGFDHGTGRLTGVTLTTRPPRDGASIGLLAPRPDLDDALPPLPGWHWWEGRGYIVCELAPTAEDVLAQVARDIAQGNLDDYRRGLEPLADEPLADQVREIATRRMSLPAEEAPFQCERLLRDCQRHLRRIEEDDED